MHDTVVVVGYRLAILRVLSHFAKGVLSALYHVFRVEFNIIITVASGLLMKYALK